MTAPERSLAQRLNALEHANAIRKARARLKADVRAGRRSALDILGEPPEYVSTMKVCDLLLAIPKVGRVKTSKYLTQCRISPSKTIGGLSQRQRDELVSLLRRQPDPAISRPSTTVHARAASGVGSVCPTRAPRPRLTSSPERVTCLTCASMLRAEIRARIAGAA